jgi:hypothetical protein
MRGRSLRGGSVVVCMVSVPMDDDGGTMTLRMSSTMLRLPP